MANVFMCHLEEKLTRDGLIPYLYRRYVDDIDIYGNRVAPVN